MRYNNLTATANASLYANESNPWDDEPETPKIVNPATEKQINFIVKLLSERGLDVSPFIKRDLDGHMIITISKPEASKMISTLLDTPKPKVPAKPTDPKTTGNAAAPEVTEGMYRTPDGTIFKVQRAVHGSGHLYAKRLVTDTDPETDVTDVWFEYAAGAIRKLRPEHKMSLEEAKEFGALYGSCCVCSRTLTDEGSIEAGIGPVCAKKYF